MKNDIYRAGEPLSIAEVAARRGIAVKDCYAAVKRNFLLEGEYALLPCGEKEYARLSAGDIFRYQKSPALYRRVADSSGLPFLYLGCPCERE